jgi:hypothetical protein
MICFAAPPPLLPLSEAVSAWGMAGSETLRAILGAFDDAAEGAAGTGACFDNGWAERLLMSLLSSRKLSVTVLRHVMTLLCSTTVPSSLKSGPFLKTTSMLLPSRSRIAALK